MENILMKLNYQSQLQLQSLHFLPLEEQQPNKKKLVGGGVVIGIMTKNTRISRN